MREIIEMVYLPTLDMDINLLQSQLMLDQKNI